MSSTKVAFINIFFILVIMYPKNKMCFLLSSPSVVSGSNRYLWSRMAIYSTTKMSAIIGDESHILNTGRFCQVGITVTDIKKSIEFYQKIGFKFSNSGLDTMTDVAVLTNNAGLQLHLLKADTELVEPNKNILMDFAEDKYPGHTHICISVSSVLGAMNYLMNNEINISGERPPLHVRQASTPEKKLIAIFCRDPDRNVIEFEDTGYIHTTVDIDTSIKGERGEEEQEKVTVEYDFINDLHSSSQTLDHVGTRISNPLQRWSWYAKHLGFYDQKRHYELDPNPLSNGFPWIAANKEGVEMNYLPNANKVSIPISVVRSSVIDSDVDVNTKVRKNVLINDDGLILPGILYIGLVVDDAIKAGEILQAAGVEVFTDEEVLSEVEGGGNKSEVTVTYHESVGVEGMDNKSVEIRKAAMIRLGRGKVLPFLPGKSIFVCDDDATLYRLISADVALSRTS